MKTQLELDVEYVEKIMKDYGMIVEGKSEITSTKVDEDDHRRLYIRYESDLGIDGTELRWLASEHGINVDFISTGITRKILVQFVTRRKIYA